MPLLQYWHLTPRIASGRGRLLVALSCLLLMLPVGMLRTVSTARALGTLTESESRSPSEVETETEVLHEVRAASRRTRDSVRCGAQSCCKCEPSNARLCNERVGFVRTSRSAELSARNGCGAVLRC